MRVIKIIKMKQKFLNIKKAIEELEEIENLIVESRKTIKWNRENLNKLKNVLAWEKYNDIDNTNTSNRIYELESESTWQRNWIKDAKVEKQEIENSLNLLIK